jgi:hypothetical protein
MSVTRKRRKRDSTNHLRKRLTAHSDEHPHGISPEQCFVTPVAHSTLLQDDQQISSRQVIETYVGKNGFFDFGELGSRNRIIHVPVVEIRNHA